MNSMSIRVFEAYNRVKCMCGINGDMWKGSMTR